MNQDDLNSKREKARQAMEEQDHREARQLNEAEMGLKRYRARIAMESHEHKQRREEREKKAAEKKALEEKLAADLERQKQEDAERQEKVLRTAREEEEAEERQKQDRLEGIHSKENLINEIKQDASVSLSALHTLNTDIQKAVVEDHMSLTQMAIREEAERRARAKQKASSSAPFAAALLLVITIGAAAGFFAWRHYSGQPLFALPEPTKETSAVPKINSIVFAEEHIAIDVGNKTATEVRAEIQQQRHRSKAVIANLYFTKPTASNESGWRMIGLRETLSALAIDVPSTILQFLNQNFMVGVHRGSLTSVFLIVTTPHFEGTAYAFLQQENLLAKSLYPLLTGDPLPREFEEKAFTDRTVKNIDIRVLADMSDTPVFMYSFIDRKTLVITQTEEAMLKVYASHTTADAPAVSE